MSDKSEIENRTKKNIDNFFEDITTDSEPNIHNVKTENDDKINYTEKVSNIYREILNREPDIGGLKYYSNQLKFKLITEEKISSILKESDEYKKLMNITDDSKNTKEQDKIQNLKTNLVYCMIGTNRLDEIKPYIETVLPFIDKFIFIDGGSIDGTTDYLNSINKDNKIEVYVHEWKDKFSEQRNNYLNVLKSKEYDGWIIASDTDEHFTIETLNQLQQLIANSNKGETYSGVKFQVEDIIVDDDDRNKTLSKKINSYWKSLMFKFNPEIHYIGEPHETLAGYNIKWLQTDFIYQHIRSKLHILTRATENFFISNSNRYSDKWADFRWLCTENNLLIFKDFWNLFKDHKLPEDIENWINTHRDDNEDTGDSEVREMALLYNSVLPKRNKQQSLSVYSVPQVNEISKSFITIPNESYSVSATLEPCCHIQGKEKQKNMTHEKRRFFITEQKCDCCESTDKIKEVTKEAICNDLKNLRLYLCEDCLQDLFECFKEYFGEI